MANKIHFKATVSGTAACAAKRVGNSTKFRKNARTSYAAIPVQLVVGPDEFRATPDEHRCAHCAEKFTPMMNERRTRAGKPLYSDAFTKTLA